MSVFLIIVAAKTTMSLTLKSVAEIYFLEFSGKEIVHTEIWI